MRRFDGKGDMEGKEEHHSHVNPFLTILRDQTSWLHLLENSLSLPATFIVQNWSFFLISRTTARSAWKLLASLSRTLFILLRGPHESPIRGRLSLGPLFPERSLFPCQLTLSALDPSRILVETPLDILPLSWPRLPRSLPLPNLWSKVLTDGTDLA